MSSVTGRATAPRSSVLCARRCARRVAGDGPVRPRTRIPVRRRLPGLRAWRAGLDNGSPGCPRNRDDAVVSDTELAWSDETGEASWIGERLAPFGAYVVTSVVPGGFRAFAPGLQPADEP